MRKAVIIVIAVIVVVLGAGALLLPRLIDVNRYHDRIERELEARLGRDVTLGRMNLSIFPLAIRVENTAIAEDPSFRSGRPFAQAQELFVAAQLFPLLRGNVEVDSIRLVNPKIELIRNQQGTWNFASLATAKGKQTPAGSKQQQLKLGELQIENGEVGLTDYQQRRARAVYSNIDLELEDLAPDSPFSVKAAANLPQDGGRIALDAKAGPINQENMAATKLDGEVEFDSAQLSSIGQFVQSDALKGLKGIATGRTEIKNEGNKMSANGSLTLKDGAVRGVNIGYPITADYRVASDAGVLRIEQGKLKLGDTPVAISGTINTNATPMQMDVKLNAQDASIAEAARLASAFGVAFNPGTEIKGNMTADLTARGATENPVLNGSASARNLQISGKDLPQTVKVPAVELALTPQAVRSNEFTASSGSTNLTGQFTLGNYTAQAKTIDARFRTQNANIAELLGIAKAYGAEAAEGVTGSGVLSLDVIAKGPLSEAGKLNLSGTGSVRNASVQTPAIKQPLKISNATIRFSDDAAILDNVAASLGSTNVNGQLTVRNFNAPQVQFTLNADKLNVGELQKIFATDAQQAAPKTQAGAGAAAQPQGQQPSALMKATGKGQLAVKEIVYDDLKLNNVRGTLNIDRGIYTLNPLTADVYNGVQTGSITVNTRTNPTTYAINSKVQGVESNSLLSAVTNVKQTLYGLLAANANTQFKAAPDGQFARTLDGKVSLNLKDGRIANMNLLNQLASIGKFTGIQQKTDPFTKLLGLSGDFNINDGVAQTDNLRAQIEGGTLAGVGSVNLASQQLDMRLTAVLSQALSQQVGGQGIGGFMNTALANRSGELVIPVIVTGTFSDPKFAPDLQKVAQMKLQNLLPTSGNPGSLTSGILGGLLGDNKQDGDQAGPQDALGGIVGALSGRKRQDNQQAQPDQQQGTQNNAQPNRQQSQQEAIADAIGGLLGGKKKKPEQQPPPEQKPQ